MTVDRAWFYDRLRAYLEAEATAPSGFPISEDIHACDDRQGGASFDAHYARCDLWAASRIVERFNDTGQRVHVDVGSRVDGFCTHLLAGGVDFVDPGFDWPGFMWRQGDARALATMADGYTHSLSCLHAAEHIGLGRYGDEIDPHGMAKCMAALARVLAPGGRLYFACPIGRQQVVFNAHRVTSPAWVCETFAALGLTLESFAAVDDAGAWHPEARPADFEGASYSCGCFLFTKGGG